MARATERGALEASHREPGFSRELCPSSLSASRSGPRTAQARLNFCLRPRGCDVSGDALAARHSPHTHRAAHHLRSACHLPQELQAGDEPPATADNASTLALLVEAAALQVPTSHERAVQWMAEPPIARVACIFGLTARVRLRLYSRASAPVPAPQLGPHPDTAQRRSGPTARR